jgi:hypothetical protein
VRITLRDFSCSFILDPLLRCTSDIYEAYKEKSANLDSTKDGSEGTGHKAHNLCTLSSDSSSLVMPIAATNFPATGSCIGNSTSGVERNVSVLGILHLVWKEMSHVLGILHVVGKEMSLVWGSLHLVWKVISL